MLQLQIDISTVLSTLSDFARLHIPGECLYEIIAHLIAHVIEFEVTILSSETDMALLSGTQCIGIVALQLEAEVLLLTVDISGESSQRVIHLYHVKRQRERPRQYV